MKFINTAETNIRYAATLLSTLEDDSQSVKIYERKVVVDEATVYGNKQTERYEYVLSLENGLSFGLEILDGEDDEIDSTPFYVNAKYLGTAIETCIGSDTIAFYKEKGKFRVGAFMNDETKQFGFESEFEYTDPYDDIMFENEDAKFSMASSDIMELFGMCDIFDNIDVCRKNGTLSYRASNGNVTTVTKYTLSNMGQDKDVPDFKINIDNATFKLMSFIGTGEVEVYLDFKNKTLRTSDGKMTVVAKYADNKYESIRFNDGEAKFTGEKGVFGTTLKTLCGSLQNVKGNKIAFQYIDKSHIAAEWVRNGIGEISVLMDVKEAKRFHKFKVKADILSVAIACADDSSIMMCETEAKQNVILCSNKRYLRKIIF